jgi:hypothetical protein
MKTIFVVLTALTLFSFVLVQPANIQSANAQATKFKITSTSVFIGNDNEIKQIQNSTKVVQTLNEALQLTKAGLTEGKGISKTLIVTKNSTQLVDGDTALVILEKALRSASVKTPAPQVVAEHGFWVYLGGGDSYHIQIVTQ